jgi:CHAD domain-containing protein
MYKLESKNYLEVLGAILQKSKDRLDSYLADPSEENVHDVRTSIRRLEAAYSILPKKIRQKRKIDRFVASHRKFFKANSKIRDYDIIRQKLDSMPLATEEIKNLLQNMKSRKLRLAKKRAKQASKLKFPKSVPDTTLQPKLEKRFRKLTIRLVEKIQSLIPVVVKSEQNVDELHELRKDCKKLRYLMELIPESSGFVGNLKQMQDLLGNIHDSDITIEFLSKHCSKHKNVDEALKIEVEKRRHLYNDFVRMYSEFNKLQDKPSLLNQ